MSPYVPYEITWSGFCPDKVPSQSRTSALGSIPAFSPEDALVALFDDEVLLGSGVLVALQDGSSAIVTARHVVVDLMVTGTFHCLVPASGWRTLEPTALSVHPRCDIALVRLPAGVSGGIPWSRWDPSTSAPISGEVFAVGFPGAWKGPVDNVARTISGLTALIAGCLAEHNAPARGRKTLGLPSCGELPSTFGGMSGGPVFSPAGNLLGVVTHEKLTGAPGLLAAELRESTSLVYPFVPGAAVPQDLMRQVAIMVVPVQYRDGRTGSGKPFHVVGLFEHFWSSSDPEHCISRLIAIGCAAAPGAKRFTVNTESVFWPNASGLEHQIQECRIELDQLLTTPGMEALCEGPEPSVAALELAQEMISRVTSSPVRIALAGDEA